MVVAAVTSVAGVTVTVEEVTGVIEGALVVATVTGVAGVTVIVEEVAGVVEGAVVVAGHSRRSGRGHRRRSTW